MRTEDLDYDLPERLIAQRPPSERDGGRLLVLHETALEQRWVRDWPELVEPGSLVVVNDTLVQRARLLGQRQGTNGKVELLVLEPAEFEGQRAWAALAKAKRPLAVGDAITVAGHTLSVVDRTVSGGVLLTGADLVDLMQRHGHVPLPPYVRRGDDQSDIERYQTLYARHPGSAAAPTAGLHLSERVLASLERRAIEIGALTLNVGLGTFRPVRTPTLAEHPMHHEQYEVSEHLVEQVARARTRGKPVVAVGTTVVRALESAAADGELRARCEHTALMIAPGYRFRVVDALLTNFHAPRSTLLALVYAFAGQERVRAAYREAVACEYRFLSYGDAMWLPNRYE